MSRRDHRLHYMDMYPQPTKKPKRKLMQSWWWLLLFIPIWYFKVPLLGFIGACVVLWLNRNRSS
jgi:hypothetical protein